MTQQIVLTAALFLFALTAIAQKSMGNKKMGKILKKEATEIEGQLGNWQLMYQERLLFVVTDEAHNRMRIFTPVIEAKELDISFLQAMLEANFHSALDAKYSLYEGFVVTVFTHRLQELTEEQFIDALRQVATLAHNFGTTFSSTDLIFGQDQEEEKKVNKSPTRPKTKKS